MYTSKICFWVFFKRLKKKVAETSDLFGRENLNSQTNVKLKAQANVCSLVTDSKRAAAARPKNVKSAQEA